VSSRRSLASSLCVLVVLSCAAARPRFDEALARSCAASSCPDSFAAAKAHALEDCARRADRSYLVRSCERRDEIKMMGFGGLISSEYSFEKEGGRLASFCSFDDQPASTRCVGEPVEERVEECQWQPLCSGSNHP
jgi:hypothetical protein